jgi:hypothetical protein
MTVKVCNRQGKTFTIGCEALIPLPRGCRPGALTGRVRFVLGNYGRARSGTPRRGAVFILPEVFARRSGFFSATLLVSLTLTRPGSETAKPSARGPFEGHPSPHPNGLATR